MVQSSLWQAGWGLCGGGRFGQARGPASSDRVQGNPWCGAFWGDRRAFPAGPVSWAASGGSARLQPPVTHSQGAGEGGFLEAVTPVPLCNQGFGRL